MPTEPPSLLTSEQTATIISEQVTVTDEKGISKPTISNGIYFTITELMQKWSKFLEDEDEDSVKCIMDYMRVPQIYVLHSEWEFYVGTSCHSFHRQILVDEDQMKVLKIELEAVLARRLPKLQPNTKYQDVESIRIKNSQEYQAIAKSLSRHNQIRRQQERQLHRRQLLETAKDLRRAKTHIFIALDIESWEKDHTRILEIGWSMYDARRDRYLDVHYNVSEFRHLVNQRYVPNHRDKFVFGTSQWATLKEVVNALKKDIYHEEAPIVFIGHSVHEDIRYLKKLGVEVPGTAIIFDTAHLYQAVSGASQAIGLGKMLDELQIEYFFLHNAGNDAHYTLEAFLAMTKPNE
jgi:hypothetical protein